MLDTWGTLNKEQKAAALDAADAELKELLETSENRKREYDRLLRWADLYDKSSFAAKKMIVSQFIKAVLVGRDYNIEGDFNVSFDEFEIQRKCRGRYSTRTHSMRAKKKEIFLQISSYMPSKLKFDTITRLL